MSHPPPATPSSTTLHLTANSDPLPPLPFSVNGPLLSLLPFPLFSTHSHSPFSLPPPPSPSVVYLPRRRILVVHSSSKPPKILTLTNSPNSLLDLPRNPLSILILLFLPFPSPKFHSLAVAAATQSQSQSHSRSENNNNNLCSKNTNSPAIPRTYSSQLAYSLGQDRRCEEFEMWDGSGESGIDVCQDESGG